MGILSWFGQTGTKRPWGVTIEYEDGMMSVLNLNAEDETELLALVRYWMVRKPARRVEMVRRLERVKPDAPPHP